MIADEKHRRIGEVLPAFELGTPAHGRLVVPAALHYGLR